MVARFPKVDGDLVFAVPSRSVLLFTGSKNAAGLAFLRQLAGEVAGEADHPLTPTLFVRRGGKIARF